MKAKMTLAIAVAALALTGCRATGESIRNMFGNAEVGLVYNPVTGRATGNINMPVDVQITPPVSANPQISVKQIEK